MNQRAATLFFTPLCLYGGGDQEEARDSDDLIDGLIFISLCSFLGNWRNRIRLDLLMFQPLFRLSVCFELPCVTALIIKISDSAYHGAFVSQFFFSRLLSREVNWPRSVAIQRCQAADERWFHGSRVIPNATLEPINTTHTE